MLSMIGSLNVLKIQRVDGLRVKRFFVSEDPEVIKSYIAKSNPKRTYHKSGLFFCPQRQII